MCQSSRQTMSLSLSRRPRIFARRAAVISNENAIFATETLNSEQIMKKSAIALLAALPLLLAACSHTPAADAPAGGEWRQIDPKELTDNPIVKVGSEWMALAAGREGDMNAMTIGWGQWGVLWGRPVVTVYVSSSRYTYEFMERNEYFTVTGFPEQQRQALSYIGSHSGRDGDKLADAGLTTQFTELGNPIFAEANLAIECRLLYKQQMDREQCPEGIREMYDSGVGVHSMYIGEIVNVWIKE